MKIYNICIDKVKFWFILNRKNLSKCGISQFFFLIYDGYYKFVSFCYSLGSNVVCPACGFVGKKFVKSTCPKCWSGSRHRLLALYTKNILKPSTNSQILDIAPNRATSYIFNKNLYKNYIRASGSRPVPSPLINQFTIFTPFSDNFCYSYLKPFCTHLR
jgi:hypothetical protein